ncbi:alpha/beta hydrolase [Acidicapsa acidisoli]|uniref:alpha/beta hydrolase n=1 Tax=Acidicapsa acidisoli TaxID=1615681 RepID=UPI0021DF7255|nr:alpha/beta hydrolase-fold protein [Acidicapsa acidisoli]
MKSFEGMRRTIRTGVLSLATVLVLAASHAQQPVAPLQHAFFHVALDKSFASSVKTPVSGRLLIFIGPASSDSKPSDSVDMQMMAITSVYIAAKEVPSLAPGASVDIDADDIVFPEPLSQAASGKYRVQAVLDVHHSYNYDGRSAGDIVSAPASIDIPFADASAPALTLTQILPEPPDPLAQNPEVSSAIRPIDLVSPSLTSFWGREIHMRGWVLLPPGYGEHPNGRYPTVYFTHGFGGTLSALRARYGPILYDRMKQGKMPNMIWVLLDESSPTGTHEFADGVNNGPWGTALTTELIPSLESRYRMDARTSGRFLQGHSSGGWATLWLQTRYPTIFGGTWSTSPDPSDFHFFSTIDLYAPHANFYRTPEGTLHPMLRDHGEPHATMQQLAQVEQVLGDYGGQLASFEWVFSPRGPDGRPAPLFNRITGDIDPTVATYWREHYDIVERLKNNWNTIGPDLKGRIHLFVGTDDTFYLDGAAHSLQSTLDQLGGDAHFTFLPGRTHFNLYLEGTDRYALFDRIAAEMYQVARPDKN